MDNEHIRCIYAFEPDFCLRFIDDEMARVYDVVVNENDILVYFELQNGIIHSRHVTKGQLTDWINYDD